ncbi:MAG: ABC transporter permease [Phycisphaerales bacterium]
MGTLWQDIRYGFRALVSNPGFALPAILCLGLGIGACTAILSVVNSVLFRPLPYTDPERLVAIDEYSLEGSRGMGFSNRLLLDMREQTGSFEEIALSTYASFNLTGGEFPENVDAARVSANLFKLLGARPLLGRAFLPGEDQPGKSDVAVISHRLWQRRFGSDPNLVGKTIPVIDMQPGLRIFRSGEGKTCTVVGIMPPGFLPPRQIGECEIWVPLVFQPDESDDRTLRVEGAIGRLKAGTTREQAQTEVDLLAERLAQQHQETYKEWAIQIRPLRDTFVFGEIRKSLWVLLGAVGFVLLIACANVANMLLARSASRQTEMAVRATLGASRWRLIRQLLTESVLLSLLGAALGLLLGHWGIGLLKPLIPRTLPQVWDIGMDAPVLGLTLLILVATGVGCGLAPARQLSKTNLTKALKEGVGRFIAGPGSRPLRDLLVVSQVALALVLLVGAGLLIQTLVRLFRVDTGFETRNLMAFSVDLPRRRYGGAEMNTFRQQLLERLRSIPGVLSVGMATDHWQRDCPCSVGTHDYFRAMGIPLLQGRYLTDRDIASGDNNIIINEAAARELWPGENPIGKKADWGLGRFLTVVGVVKTIRSYTYAHDAGPRFYLPYQTMERLGRAMPTDSEFVVRSAGDPLSLVKAIRGEIAALDSRLPVTGFTTLEDRLRSSTARQRLYMRLLTTFAVMGLVLAAAGIYGVISYSVAQRTHEIGVRMALGAPRSSVLKLMVKRGLGLIAVGLVIGAGGALALTRVLGSFLYDVTPTDPATFVLVSLLLAAVGLSACYIPARRATRIDPMSALRYE